MTTTMPCHTLSNHSLTCVIIHCLAVNVSHRRITVRSSDRLRLWLQRIRPSTKKDQRNLSPCRFLYLTRQNLFDNRLLLMQDIVAVCVLPFLCIDTGFGYLPTRSEYMLYSNHTRFCFHCLSMKTLVFIMRDIWSC